MSLLRCYGEGGDLHCPGCGQDFNPEWDTEYGDPVWGEHYVYFPCCDTTYKINVTITVSYSSGE